MSYRNLAGDILVYDFRISFNTPYLSTNKQKIIIPYQGVGNPTLTASLVLYKYSLDNGATWYDMTPSTGTQLVGLAFSPTGTAHTFEWESKTDIGTSMYNTSIRIKLKAQSGSIMTDEAPYSLYFERTTTNLAAQAESAPFPDDFSGVPGNELLRNAPKS